jgi:hypothetical protein
MAITHSAEHNIRANTKGGLLFGIAQGLLVDADLASTAAAAKAAVQLGNAKRHVSERMFGPRVEASLDQIANFDATYLGGSDADKASMLAISSSPGGSTLIL